MLSRLDRNFLASLIQPAKFLINGVVATGVHFGVLTFCFKILLWKSAGLSNMTASVFGITSSFLGNRYFVFHNSDEPLNKQISRFIALSVTLAAVHGFVMYLATDVYGTDYRISFLLATVIQTILSFLGNKIMVFKV
jgi:putative flippase GtrA